ncbi:MAG: DUF2279 domain-containing protein [Flavobacteriales bacterium]|nr:DUF2279 domain-containing protein [Flavobacteriales bacterium]
MRSNRSTLNALLLLSGLLGPVHPLRAQDTAATQVNRPRLLGVAVGGGLVVAGTLVALDKAWYSQYERVPFQTFNDGDEWLQMDKVGHAYSTYTVGRWGKGLLDWSGVDDRTATWVGGSIGLIYLTGVEYLDAHSAGWGWSWWDMAANVAGTGLFIGQELGWHEQRFRLKYSAHLSPYAAQDPDLLGSTVPQRILKDYNGATYWLSVAPSAFKRSSARCKWFSLSFGYGAEGLVSAMPADNDPPPVRQFYLSFDVDMERIPTRSKFLRTTFFLLNCIKVPAPALEYRSNGVWYGHWLYF